MLVGMLTTRKSKKERKHAMPTAINAKLTVTIQTELKTLERIIK